MYREQKINISEDFAVLCCFWNRTPEQIVRFYLEHISLSALINRLEIDTRLKPEYSHDEQVIMLKKIIDDPYALATFFAIVFVPPKPIPTYPKKLPKLNRKTPF